MNKDLSRVEIAKYMARFFKDKLTADEMYAFFVLSGSLLRSGVGITFSHFLEIIEEETGDTPTDSVYDAFYKDAYLQKTKEKLEEKLEEVCKKKLMIDELSPEAKRQYEKEVEKVVKEGWGLDVIANVVSTGGKNET